MLLEKKHIEILIVCVIFFFYYFVLSSIHWWLKTLRRKGLGLDGAELEHEDNMQTGQEKYLLNEGMDLSIARQRYYVSMIINIFTLQNFFLDTVLLC